MNILLCLKGTNQVLSFEPVLVMYTTYYFEYSLEQLKENKQQVKLMKVLANLYLIWLYFYHLFACWWLFYVYYACF